MQVHEGTLLTAEQLHKLNKKNWSKLVFDIFMTWSIVGGSLYLSHLSLYFLPITMLIIGARMHAMTVLMHDAAHNLVSKNQTVNDMISNIFCAFPVMLSTEIYRKSHYRHHQYTQTDKDPNYVIMQTYEAWHFPKPKEKVKKILLKDALGITMNEHMIVLKEWQIIPNFQHTTRLEQITFPIFMLALIGTVASLGLWKEFLIFQASAVLVNPMVRIRTMSEHVHRESEGTSKINKLHETTSIGAPAIERFFLSPFNINRHLEHHIYPTIPYYNLEKAHRIMKQTELWKTHCRYELDGYLTGKRTSFNEIICESPENPSQQIRYKAA